MSAELDVDFTGLRRTAPKFAETAASLQHVVDRLRSAVDAEGSCWGGDDAGQAFATRYLPGVAAAGTALPGLVTALVSIRTTLDATASEFEAAEQTNTDHLTRGH